MIEGILALEANKVSYGPRTGFLWGVLNGAFLPIISVIILEYFRSNYLTFIDPYVVYIAIIGVVSHAFQNVHAIGFYLKLRDGIPPEVSRRIFACYSGVLTSTVLVGFPLLFAYALRESVSQFSLDWFSPTSSRLWDWYLFSLGPISSAVSFGTLDVFDIQLSLIKPITFAGKLTYAVYTAASAFFLISALAQLVGEINQRHVQVEARVADAMRSGRRPLSLVGLLWLCIAILAQVFSTQLPETIVRFAETTWPLALMLLIVANAIWFYMDLLSWKGLQKDRAAKSE